jgi:putative oxidoreductase
MFAAAAGLGEVGGGILTALGLGGPIGPALIIMVMIVAILSVHAPKGFWASNGGYELNTMNIAAALTLAFVGFGGFSLDAAFGITNIWSDDVRWIAVGAAIVLALGNMAVRRTSHTTQTTA